MLCVHRKTIVARAILLLDNSYELVCHYWNKLGKSRHNSFEYYYFFIFNIPSHSVQTSDAPNDSNTTISIFIMIFSLAWFFCFCFCFVVVVVVAVVVVIVGQIIFRVKWSCTVVASLCLVLYDLLEMRLLLFDLIKHEI